MTLAWISSHKQLMLLTAMLMFAVFPRLHGAAAETGTGDRAEIVLQDVPQSMDTGQSYTINIHVKNTGDTAWSRARQYALASKYRQWGIQRVEIDPNAIVQPGDTKTFKFKVTAPSQPGAYEFQWQMVHEEDQWFGAPTTLMRIHVETGGNRVKFISQLVPSTMDAGSEYTVMIQYKNGGKTPWSGATGYRLVSQNPTQNKLWGADHVKLDSDRPTAPGEVATIRFKIKAPLQAGEYNFQWQLYHDSLGFFGDRTPDTRIKVGGAGRGNDAEFVIQEFPGLINEPTPYAVMRPTQSFTVNIMFKNIGTTAWKGGAYKLASQQPPNNLNWFIDHVDMNAKDEVKPGEFKTFSFTAVAPSQPGIYDFQWQMFQEGLAWFGARSAMVKITVR